MDQGSLWRHDGKTKPRENHENRKNRTTQEGNEAKGEVRGRVH